MVWVPGVTTGAEMATEFNEVKSNKPHGLFDYNDTATAITPLSVTGGGASVVLTNDGLGPFTNKLYKPTGVTDIWDVDLTTLDLSQLPLGSKVDYRIDVVATITGTNAEVELEIELGIGGDPYTLDIGRAYFKSAGAKPIVMSSWFYVGEDNTKNNGGHFMIKGSNNMTVVVRGWACYVTRY